jgi:hypothetical protein
MSNNEISDEAKKTRKNTKLAQTRKRNAAHRLRQRRKTPLGRLHTDSSCRSENLGRRLRWLAHEWQIPEKQLPKATSCPTDELLDLAEKYHIRLGWLLGGDRKELRDMMRAHKLARGVFHCWTVQGEVRLFDARTETDRGRGSRAAFGGAAQ